MGYIYHKLPAKPTRFIDCLRLHIRVSGLAYRKLRAPTLIML